MRWELTDNEVDVTKPDSELFGPVGFDIFGVPLAPPIRGEDVNIERGRWG